LRESIHANLSVGRFAIQIWKIANEKRRGSKEDAAFLVVVPDFSI